MNVSNLTACAISSDKHFTLNDNSAAYSGTKRYNNNIAIAFGSTLPCFAKCGNISIVSAFNIKTGKFFHLALKVNLIFPSKIYCLITYTVWIYRTRNSDSDTDDIVLFNILLFHLIKY